MNLHLYKEDDFTTTNWSGGTSCQLAISPKGTEYADRNFMWRLAQANCELDESTFTNLPDYDRVLMVLEGEAVLNYEGTRVVKLKEMEQDSFDGAWQTKCFGKLKDLNLMVKKGCKGFMDIINPEKENRAYPELHEHGFNPALVTRTHLLYVKDGYAVVSAGSGSKMLSPGQLLVVECEAAEKPDYMIMGEGTVIRCEIYAEADSDTVGPVYIPEEKATFSDFLECMIIANTRFPGARVLFPKLKKVWYDEALTRVLRKMEKTTMPVSVYALGLILVVGILFKHGVPENVIWWGALVWTILDFIIISPLLYFIASPKPVKKHIKNVDELTPYEQKVRQRQMTVNERTERLLTRYSPETDNDPFKKIFKRKKNG